jgi:hypothetical protein
MVLDATISVRTLAGLLRLPTWQVVGLIERGDLQAWSLPGGLQRIGWRAARPDELRAYIENGRAKRA